MVEMMKTIRKIYRKLQDEESKYIFENRLLHVLTGEMKFIENIIQALPEKQKMDAMIEMCKRDIDKVVIWGAGYTLSMLTDIYPDFKFQCLCDRNPKKQEEGWKGLAVISPETLVEKKRDAYVVICTMEYYDEITEYLQKNGFRNDRVINIGVLLDSLYEREYFDEDIMQPIEDEVFIDGGCYDCNTDERFMKWCSGNYKKIYAFEPDERNYDRCLKKCEELRIQKIELINKGLWNCATELFFREKGTRGSKIEDKEEEGLTAIHTAAIDDIVEGRVTFIKLDVEGAELKVLQGAEKTIRKYRPRLAICIYHKGEDILEIPEYILSLHSDYRLYIRHYHISGSSTILYAV